MKDDFDEVLDDIARDIASAQQVAAQAIVDDVKQRVSIPVDKSTTPWTRSKPGEPPRKDTGRLQSSIQAETLNTGDQIATSINPGDVPYAERLQMEMARPIFERVLDEHTDDLLDRIAQAI